MPAWRMAGTSDPVPVFFDDRQLAHQPALELHNGSWAEYAEKASRAEIILDQFAAHRPAIDHGLEPILRVHSSDYVDFLRSAIDDWLAAGRSGDAIGYTWPVVRRRDLHLDRIDARLGRYSYDAATPITAGTWEAAYWSAQAALTATAAVIEEAFEVTFALCRPPGHHAGPDYLGRLLLPEQLGDCRGRGCASRATGCDAGHRLSPRQRNAGHLP